jgi:hypothetical protein
MVGGGPRRRLTTPSLEAARCELTVNAGDRFDLAGDILAPLVKENFPGAQVHTLIMSTSLCPIIKNYQRFPTPTMQDFKVNTMYATSFEGQGKTKVEQQQI